MYRPGTKIFYVQLDGDEEITAYEDELEPEEHLSSASTEANAKPSEAEDHSFGIGDTVRVKDDARGPSGIKRKCCGREGKVESVLYNGTVGVEFETGLVILESSELDLVEKGVIESDAKQSATNRPSVQYRHPENPDLEWTGRGRKPKWVEHWITQGGTLEDLKVEGAAA